MASAGDEQHLYRPRSTTGRSALRVADVRCGVGEQSPPDRAEIRWSEIYTPVSSAAARAALKRLGDSLDELPQLHFTAVRTAEGPVR